MIGLRESGQKRRTDGRLQDFVHEATQIDKLPNSEQNRHLQTLNSKQIKLQRVTIIIISIQNKSNLSSTRGPIISQVTTLDTFPRALPETCVRPGENPTPNRFAARTVV